MHESFAKYVDTLHPPFDRLVNMTPVKIGELRRPLAERCIYLFSENGTSLYDRAGRIISGGDATAFD